MVDKEQLMLLFQSIAAGSCRAWNDWRIEHSEVRPELAGLELWDQDLPFINLSNSDLRLANLSGVNFYRANLQNSDLSMAVLKGSFLREANLKGAKLFHADLQGSDLRGANLAGADLRRADLTDSLLKGADLSGAHIDTDVLQQADASYIDNGVSRLERVALLLSKNSKSKEIHPAISKARKARRFEAIYRH